MGERVSIISSAGDPGGGATLAAWHTLDGIADSYDTGMSAWGTEPDLAAWLAARLDLSGAGWGVARPRPLVVSVGPHTWTEPGDDHIRQATADVVVSFPDGSSLTRPGVTFTNYCRENGRVGAVTLGGGGAYIDTGLLLNYSYEFRVTGYTPNGAQSTLLGAFTSTSTRTTLRLLGGSDYFQHQWPGNQEIRGSGISARSLLSYVQNKDGVTLTQDGNTYTHTYAGTQSGTADVKIILMNETPGGDKGNGVLVEAEIRDGEGHVLRHFEPWFRDGELVILDTANDNTVYRPASGKLAEVAI